MSKRVIVPSLIGAVALGGIATAGPSAKPTVENGAARYLAPTTGAAGSVTFTAMVTDDSGIRSLKVLAWPKSSDLKPTAQDMESV
ncbi:DUF5707 domain-containing protein, partial [Streptomyces sp. NPDC056835]|uniref:DUF5707 domain-containing protein n=1 Tax=Streptomyces sp. NPDC056835 TaxID=3345956 RepID=UPI0036D1EA2B